MCLIGVIWCTEIITWTSLQYLYEISLFSQDYVENGVIFPIKRPDNVGDDDINGDFLLNDISFTFHL